MNLKISYRFTQTILTIFVIILAGCEQQTSSQLPNSSNDNTNKITLLDINANEFMFTENDRGGDISFKSSDFNHCRLSFIRSKLKPGYHTRRETFDEGDIDLTCLTDSKLYTMSPISPTYIDLTVTERDDKSILIRLNFTLFWVRAKESIERNIELEITGSNLKKLMHHK